MGHHCFLAKFLQYQHLLTSKKQHRVLQKMPRNSIITVLQKNPSSSFLKKFPKYIRRSDGLLFFPSPPKSTRRSSNKFFRNTATVQNQSSLDIFSKIRTGLPFFLYKFVNEISKICFLEDCKQDRLD